MDNRQGHCMTSGDFPQILDIAASIIIIFKIYNASIVNDYFKKLIPKNNKITFTGIHAI